MQDSFNLDPLTLTPKEQLAHDLAVVRAKHYRTAEVDLIASIEEVDRLRLFEKFRKTSTHAYCRDELKLSDAVASNLICIAIKSRKIEGFTEAIASGEICVSTARKMCPLMTPENKDEWLNKGKTMSKAEIEREVAKESPQPFKKAHVKSVGPDRNRVAFEAPNEFLILRSRVQNLESQRLGRIATIAEVEIAMAKAYLEKNDPVKKAERAEKRKAPPAQPTPNHRTPIPAHIEHAVRRRDRGECRVHVSGVRCGSTHFVHLHHIVGVAQGGQHTLENIVTVCSAHHRQVHEDQEITV